MIHKIEIFPHYTYPLPDGAMKLKANHSNNLERSSDHQTERECELANVEHNKFAADEDSTAHLASLSSSPPAHTNSVQPYRTCSHYGFNYPLTYQPQITIRPAHLLTAVQLQREKVIAFIKSTALSLNTGYLQQQQQHELYSIRQPRAPRLKSCEALCSTDNASKDAEKHSDSTNNNDSNGSYISVKEIKLEPTKRRRRVSKVSSDRGCESECVADGVRQLSEHERELHTPQLTHAHSLSEQFSSLLSIGGTSYPAGSHSHTAELVHYHDEEEGLEECVEEAHHEDDGLHQQHYDDDSADNYSTVFARTATPTNQRATYLLRDFLPPHAQTHDMPEHKPESEQELHDTDVKLATSTPKVRKLLNSCDDEEPDDSHLYAHHSHKQIKLTLNSNAAAQCAALKRHTAHATEETATAAAISIGLPHERYRHVTASLSEAGSSSAASSLRSLEIHININVKNSDCARTLQTHESEFRRKLERIINEEINVIAQQLSVGAQQHSADSNNLHLEHNDGDSLLDMSSHSVSARQLFQQTAHLETLSDLRLAGTLAGGQQRKCDKSARLAQAQPQSQSTKHTHSNASHHSTDSSTCYVSGAAPKADQPPSAQQREVIAMLEQELESLLNGIICANALHNHAVMCDCKMKVAQISKELRTSLSAGKGAA